MKKNNHLLTLSFVILSQTLALAQTPAPAPAPAPTSGTAPAPTDTATALDYLFNHQAGENTTASAAQGVAAALAAKMLAEDKVKNPTSMDPETRQRFQTYLGLAEVPQARIAEYFGLIDQVNQDLKVNNSSDACKLLYILGTYQDIDAGISRELGNRIETVWAALHYNSNIEDTNRKLREALDTSNHNADLLAQELRDHDRAEALKDNPSRGGGGGNGSSGSQGTLTNATPMEPIGPSTGGKLTTSIELTSEYAAGIEARSKILINEVSKTENIKQAQDDFAAYITTLFNTHRYFQVVIAANFYRVIFNQGNYPVSMEEQVNASLETNKQVADTIDAFKYKASEGDYALGCTMLQKGFVVNEYHPALQGLPREEKEKVYDYMTKLDILQSVIESHQFERVDDLIGQITSIAKDFDSTKPQALVNQIKLESMMRLGHAKLLTEQKDLPGAMKEFQLAEAAWPGNPDLKTSTSMFLTGEDTQNKAVVEFDRLNGEQNYREIMAKSIMFAPAISGDPKREDELKQAAIKVQTAEAATEKANYMAMNGNYDGAWEILEKARNDWKDDRKLNESYADLSSRAADFISSISKARAAEANNSIGFSLTWYVNAQHNYPLSDIAKEGIDRLSKRILSPSTPTVVN